MSTIIARPTTLLQDVLPLDNISTTMAAMTTSSALLFPGQLDLSKFEAALNRLVTYCPWLAGTIAVREDSEGGASKTLVVPRKEGDPQPDSPGWGYLLCEVDSKNEIAYSAETGPLNDLLPNNIHIKMIRVDLALGSVDELPIAAFKVTQFANHFALGYRLNHAFYDQAAIVDMFIFLSHLYSLDGGEITRPAPQFNPRANLVADMPAFGSQEEFEAATPSGYSKAPMGALSFGIPLKVEINFDTAKVQAVKEISPSLTTNDLLHALLTQALARSHLQRAAAAENFNSDEESAKKINIYFARNMRKPLGLPDNTTGDYVRLETFTSVIGDAVSKETSLVKLAELNRAVLTKDAKEVAATYAKECLWFRDFASLTGVPGSRASSTFLDDKLAGVITNWSSFPYQEIIFGEGSFAQELLIADAPAMCPTGCFVRVTFRHNSDGKRELSIVINSLDQDFIDMVKTIAEENDGLFKCN